MKMFDLFGPDPSKLNSNNAQNSNNAHNNTQASLSKSEREWQKRGQKQRHTAIKAFFVALKKQDKFAALNALKQQPALLHQRLFDNKDNKTKTASEFAEKVKGCEAIAEAIEEEMQERMALIYSTIEGRRNVDNPVLVSGLIHDLEFLKGLFRGEAMIAGISPLALAAMRGKENIAAWLIEQGGIQLDTEFTYQDRYSDKVVTRTAAQIAEDSGNRNIAKLIQLKIAALANIDPNNPPLSYQAYCKNHRKAPDAKLYKKYLTELNSGALTGAAKVTKTTKDKILARKIWTDVVSQTHDMNENFLSDNKTREQIKARLVVFKDEIGLNDDDDLDDIIDRCVNLIKEHAVITVTFKAGFLEGHELEDYQLLNMFEKDHRNRVGYAQNREMTEKGLFKHLSSQLHQDFIANKQSRPRYGANMLIDNTDPVQPITNYGNSFIVLKDIAKYNTLFVGNHSLNNMTYQINNHKILGPKIKAAEARWNPHAAKQQAEVKRLKDEADDLQTVEAKRKAEEAEKKAKNAKNKAYFEARKEFEDEIVNTPELFYTPCTFDHSEILLSQCRDEILRDLAYRAKYGRFPNGHTQQKLYIEGLLPAVNVLDSNLVEHIHIDSDEYEVDPSTMASLKRRGISITNSYNNPYQQISEKIIRDVKASNVPAINGVNAERKKEFTTCINAREQAISQVEQTLMPHFPHLAYDFIEIARKEVLNINAIEQKIVEISKALDQTVQVTSDQVRGDKDKIRLAKIFENIAKRFADYADEFLQHAQALSQFAQKVKGSGQQLILYFSQYEESFADAHIALMTHPSLLRMTSENGETLVHLAAAQGNARMIQLLARYGANLTEKDREGLTPSEVAANKGHQNVVDAIARLLAPKPSHIDVDDVKRIYEGVGKDKKVVGFEGDDAAELIDYQHQIQIVDPLTNEIIGSRPMEAYEYDPNKSDLLTSLSTSSDPLLLGDDVDFSLFDFILDEKDITPSLFASAIDDSDSSEEDKAVVDPLEEALKVSADNLPPEFDPDLQTSKLSTSQDKIGDLGAQTLAQVLRNAPDLQQLNLDLSQTSTQASTQAQVLTAPEQAFINAYANQDITFNGFC